MRKAFFYSVIGLLCSLTFLVSSCSDDDDDTSFNYDINLLYGTWRVTSIQQSDGSWFNVTSSIAESAFGPTYATFKSDGTYTGSGEFGNGSGTWSANGNTIYTYVDGVEYLRYEVVELSGSTCELTMTQKGSSSTLGIKCTKQ